MKFAKPFTLSLLVLAVSAANASESLEQRIQALENQTDSASGTQFEYGGYIKLDTMVSRFNRQTRAGNVGDDFLVPSTIGTDGSNSQFNTDMHARESRFFFKTATPTQLGTLSTYVEVDFLLSTQGDQRITNSYSPRVRHAVASLGNWTVGQTWSTFFTPASLPDLLDFVGPVGNGFARQPMVRFSPGNWDFALENPSTNVYQQDGSAREYDNNRLPDLIMRYRFEEAVGNYSIALVLRELSYSDSEQNLGSSSRESDYGYAMAFSARMPVTSAGHDLRAQLNVGNALGRYLGLNAFQAAQIDDDGELKLIDQVGGFVAYRHQWSGQWRSNLALSAAHADNPSSVSPDTARRYHSAHLNLIHSPIPELELGGELIWGQREDESGATGELNRLQLSARFHF
ncbi:MAG: hypothetical protein EA349_13700 [Halomonadaceae bacterium]|nr:MAG: hypothetical protein EA349_13700 [Halomonadaceae bacterium]